MQVQYGAPTTTTIDMPYADAFSGPLHSSAPDPHADASVPRAGRPRLPLPPSQATTNASQMPSYESMTGSDGRHPSTAPPTYEDMTVPQTIPPPAIHVVVNAIAAAPEVTHESRTARVSAGQALSQRLGLTRREATNRPTDGATAISPELRRKKWIMFGNLASCAIVISEIANLDVCFSEYLEDDVAGSDVDENASTTYNFMMIVLVFGLWVDFVSAVSLSLIYRSPLDIKSVHKIPPLDTRHCGGMLIMHFLTPFSWGLIFSMSGAASMKYEENYSCGGQGGDALETYLLVSGCVMIFLGCGFLLMSFATLFLACGSNPGAMHGCCTKLRLRFHRTILSKGPIFDLWWILQSAMWSYRTGDASLAEALVLVLCGAMGEVLSACGSIPPEIILELAGST